MNVSKVHHVSSLTKSRSARKSGSRSMQNVVDRIKSLRKKIKNKTKLSLHQMIDEGRRYF